MEIKIKILEQYKGIVPTRQTPNSVGYDLHSAVTTHVYVGQKATIPCGVCIAVPEGWVADVRSRSGLAKRNNIFVLNSPGTIDPDYRGEIQVMLFNLGLMTFHIEAGDRIAQLVFHKVELPDFKIVSELDTTTRGEKGFGSTG